MQGVVGFLMLKIHDHYYYGYLMHVFVAAIIGKVGLLALEYVVLHLLDSKCMSIILYAVELCHLSQSDIRSLDLAIFSFFMKLLQTKKQRCYK